MHEGDVCEGVCAKGVAHGDEGARGADGVDEVDDVAGVVEPGGCLYSVSFDFMKMRCANIRSLPRLAALRMPLWPW